MTDAEIEALVHAFRNHTLPRAAWTHHAHLTVGLWHLLHYPADEALRRLRDGIQSHNESVGVANTDTAGYHETITAFFVKMIDVFLNQTDRRRPLADLTQHLIAAIGEKDLPLKYWTRETLMATTARHTWVPPDIRSLPEVE